MLDAVMTTIHQEFSDVLDATQVTRIVLRLLIAAALGGLLGYERARLGRAAGVRTHMLVSMGAALFVLVGQQSGMDQADLSRVVQGLVTGVGFLGAGAIVKRDKSADTVQGLTTAAGVWMTAAIGICCGLGREATAVISAVLTFVVLAVVRLQRNDRQA